MERIPENVRGLPPVDLSHHYSRLTKNRNVSSVKDFYKYFTIPGIGNLAGGVTSLRPVMVTHPLTLRRASKP